MIGAPAFERAAFQNNAFQVGIFTDSVSGGGIYHRKKKKHAKKLISAYKNISAEIPEARELISVVDPYIAPIDKEELKRRREAKYVVDTLPSPSRINFVALMENSLALERYEKAVQQLTSKIETIKHIKRQEEEVVLLMMMLEI